MKVGFIGLGIMGKPMCRNLMKAGYEAVVYNRSKASVEELAAEGAQAAGSPAEVAENCQVIITMLPNSPQVREVCLGENGIASAAKEGTIVIDMSSIDPVQSERNRSRAEQKGNRLNGCTGQRRRAKGDRRNNFCYGRRKQREL